MTLMPTGERAPTKPALGYYSPLRYPGGKARLAGYIADLVRAQHPRPLSYAEPFAGGAGAALKLLAHGVVDEIHINDLDPGISAFWRAVFERTEELVELIERCDVSVKAWHRHRATYCNPAGKDDVELGFATFFLNRCNRSGILTARPIGGLEQSGAWAIDARFNRLDMVNRICYIAEFRHRVHLTELDARLFIGSLARRDPQAMLYVDPPYIVQGDALYLDKLTYDDHREVSRALQASGLRWFMTYDCDDRITDHLYTDLRCARFNIKHTAQQQHVGNEYAIFSDNLVVPHISILPKHDATWVVV